MIEDPDSLDALDTLDTLDTLEGLVVYVVGLEDVLQAEDFALEEL